VDGGVEEGIRSRICCPHVFACIQIPSLAGSDERDPRFACGSPVIVARIMEQPPAPQPSVQAPQPLFDDFFEPLPTDDEYEGPRSLSPAVNHEHAPAPVPVPEPGHDPAPADGPETPHREARPLPVFANEALSPEAPIAPDRSVRRRCSGKGPAARLGGGASRPPVGAGGPPPPGPPPDPPAAGNAPGAVDDEAEPAGEDDAETKRKVVLFYKNYWRWVQRQMDDCGDDEGEQQRLRVHWRWRGKSFETQMRLAKSFETNGNGGELASWMVEYLKKKIAGRVNRGNRFLDTRTVLLTWQGDWGLWPDVEVTDEALSADDEEARYAAIAAVVVRLRATGRASALWDEFKSAVERWTTKFYLAATGYALELCTQTLVSQRVVRAHLHLFLRAAGKLRILTPECFKFKDSLPVKSGLYSSAQAGSGRGGNNAGMYYVQAPKIGGVLTGGSLSPFRDYLVNGDWIMNLVQSNKMTYTVAREELIKSAKNLTRLLPCLDRWWQEKTRLSLKSEMVRVTEEINSSRRPFKVLPEVQAWILTHDAVRMRYQFLVLVGGSGLGKTQFAKGLVPVGAALELNMASAPEPDLREYDARRHALILFDECTPQQVLRQKKLFQCPPVEVGLAASATSCHAYQVWVHRKLFVICSNVWHYELSKLKIDDAQWLQANSVVVHVTEPLWLA